jgi:hypothetical protein
LQLTETGNEISVKLKPTPKTDNHAPELTEIENEIKILKQNFPLRHLIIQLNKLLQFACS